MNNYIELLEEYGIFNHGISVCLDPPTPPPIPLIGEYEYMDCYDYFEEPLFGLDYEQEVHYIQNHRKIHRYSRLGRFKFTLMQLLGVSGEVPVRVVRLVKREIRKSSRAKIWNHVRKVLKKYKGRRYYNRIPEIIMRISGKKPVFSYACVQLIINDFMKMSELFDRDLKFKWKRSYFLNMRFIALKLMESHGVVFPYEIPLVRTVRKRKYLLDLFSQF